MAKQIATTDWHLLALKPLKNSTETQTHVLWGWGSEMEIVLTILSCRVLQ